MTKGSKRNSVKEQAHRAFKRYKAGFPLTENDLTLIEFYYPFAFEPKGDYNG
jgi:hypothetical protein